MTYRYKNILISPFTDLDEWDNLGVTLYTKWFDRKDVVNLTSHGIMPKSRKDFEDYIKNNGNGYVVYKILYVGQTEKKEIMTIHVGNVALQDINWINRTAELAIIIGEQHYHKKGIGTYAVMTMLYHGFQKMNLHRIYTGTADVNKGMLKVAEKCGFKQEGRFEQAKIINGQYHDIITFGILEMDFDLERYEKEYLK